MKFFTFGRNGPVAPVIRPRQPLIQRLEPRRLMSLTAAPGFVPNAQAPAQIVHSFGFENLLPPPPAGAVPFSQAPIFINFTPDAAGTETQPSPSATQISPVIAAATVSTAVPAPPSDGGNSLSSMYAMLNSSTVAAIDTADAENVFTPAISTALNSGHVPVFPISSAPVEFVLTDKPGSSLAPLTAISETVPPALRLATIPALGSASAGVAGTLLPQTSFARTLETEIQNVSTLTREMVWQAGRDLAIELAHIETAADTAVIEQLNAWNGWSIAAATGAVIATAGYLQSKGDSENEKPESVFSSRMIEPSAT